MRRRRGARRAALVMLVLLGLVAAACTGDEPGAAQAPATPTPTPTPTPEPECPLTGLDAPAPRLVERPAVAVKVENDPVAYPLSGLEDAELVFEELVEGGITRFLAIYHCTDAPKVGPVRSARLVDPGIMIPITRILAAAGGNDIVRKALERAKIVILDEDTSGNAMRRISRPGIGLEHTLYADTSRLRRLGSKRFSKAPAGSFRFGPLGAGGTDVNTVEINFGGSATVRYRWKDGAWQRFDNGSPLMAEKGGQIAVENVVIEQHTVVNSRSVFDVAGNPSIELADETGKGKAVLLRDGKAFRGRWIRQRKKGPVRFVMGKGKGEAMVFAPGTIWIELVPDKKGEVKGSFSLGGKRGARR